jgi:hypothetical protein
MSDRNDRKRLRLVLAGGVSAALLIPLIAFGGIGFAKNSPSVGQYQYGKGKTTICHRTGSKKHPMHTIVVSNSAVPAHLRHGDTLGPCPPRTAPTTSSSSSNKGKDKGEHGNGKGNGNGNGNGHGKGKGKP